MDLAELQRELLAAARANPPSDGVPYAFEQRVLARLPACPSFNAGAEWSRALWRAAAPCVAVALLFSAWALFAPAPNPPAPDLTQELENTVLAAVDQDQSTDSIW